MRMFVCPILLVFLFCSCIPSAKLYTPSETKPKYHTYIKGTNKVVKTKINANNYEDIVVKEYELSEYVKEQAFGYKVAVGIQTFLIFILILWYFFVDSKRKLDYNNVEINKKEQNGEIKKEEDIKQNTQLD